jgi:peptidoglycan/LPS O-acetylase OafA/YrhL
MAGDRPSANFDGLTVLRGVFAWWVTLYHVRHWLVGTPAQGLESVLSLGYLGVDFFFVLSGFVIQHRYAQFFVGRPAGAYRRFMTLRIARIYPLHLFMSVVFLLNPLALILFGSGNPDLSRYDPGYYLLSLFLVHNWGWTSELKWNGPSWSISTEFFAYLVYPLTSLLLARRSVRTSSLLLGAGAVLLLLPLLVPAWGLHSLGGSVERFGLVRCVLEFTLGNLLAALFSCQREFMLRWYAGLLAAAFFLGVLGLMMGLPDYAVVPLLVCLLVAGALGLEIGKGIRLPALLVRMGEISYASYLCHYFIKDWYVFLDIPSRIGGIAAIVTFCLAVLCVSELLFRFIEIPGQQVFKRLLLDPSPIPTKTN